MIVYRISKFEFAVFDENKQYAVKWVGYRFICSCYDFLKNCTDISYACKHIEAVFTALRQFDEDAIEYDII